MKNRLIIGLICILLGGLVIAIPWALFPVCPHDEMKMACFYTAKAETGVGAMIAAAGILYILFKNKGIRIGLGLAQILNSALIIALPLWLTGICKMSTMVCRIGTYPAWLVAGILLCAVSVINAAYLILLGKKHEKES